MCIIIIPSGCGACLYLLCYSAAKDKNQTEEEKTKRVPLRLNNTPPHRWNEGREKKKTNFRTLAGRRWHHEKPFVPQQTTKRQHRPNEKVKRWNSLSGKVNAAGISLQAI